MTPTVNKTLYKNISWLISFFLVLSLISVCSPVHAATVELEPEEGCFEEVSLSDELAEEPAIVSDEESEIEILSETIGDAGSSETAIQLTDDRDSLAEIAEDTAIPYVLNFHFQCGGDEESASKFANIPVTEYNEEDNTYDFVMPLSWGQRSYPSLTLDVSNGVDLESLYCICYRGRSKDNTTRVLFNTTQLSAMSGGNYTSVASLPSIATRDNAVFLKFIIGTGEALEDPQVYFLQVIRSADINAITITSETGESIPVMRRNNTYYLDWPGETIQFSALAEYPPTTDVVLGETVVSMDETINVDLRDYPLNTDGYRTLPLKAKYTGNLYGADLDLTICVDTNHNFIPVITPVETPVSVEKGGSMTLTVDAYANKGYLTYQWYGSDWTSMDMPQIEGATGASYSPTTAYAGEYKYNCWVYNNFDGVSLRDSTRPNIIYVNVEPTFASEASIDDVSGDQLVIQGESRQISVTASPKDQNAVLSYQWYVNTEDSNQGGTPIEGAIEAALTLDTSVSQTRYYYCVVTASLELIDGTIGINSDAVTRPVEVTIATAADLFEGSGTAEDPFLLKTAEDYVTLHSFVNESDNSLAGVYFKQVADITLPADWTPLGRTRDGSTDIQRGANLMPFSAILDGGSEEGYTLTIPYGGQPLLGYVLGAEVKNLNIYGEQINGYGLVNNYEGVGIYESAITIDNVTIKSGTNILKSGLLGGNITTNGYAATSAGFKAIIRNCTIEEGVVIGYDGTQSMIGGFAGRFQGTIENCVNNSTVKGTDYVGGIAGTIDQAMGQFEIIDCQFGGSLEATGQHVGGIVGGGYSNVTAPNGVKPKVNGCIVTGSVTGADKVGGILGGETYGLQSWANYTFTNNTVTGKVSAANENATCVGGIVGYFANLNRHDQFFNNFFDPDQCGVTKGFGFVLSVDTDNTAYATEDGTPKGWVNGTYYYNSALNITIADEALRMSDYKAIQQMNHQRSDDPLGADAENLVKGGIPTEAYVTELQISGEFKTEYLIGDSLDTTGMVLTVVYSDGTSKEIRAEDEEFQNVVFSGFDSSALGKKVITVTYANVSADFTIIVTSDAGSIQVKLSILGADHHDPIEDGWFYTLKNGNLITWLKETEFTVDGSATV